MLGTAHFLFDDFCEKFIMQVQEHWADTERGWKHTAGHVRENQTTLSEKRREDDPDLHLSVLISH